MTIIILYFFLNKSNLEFVAFRFLLFRFTTVAEESTDCKAVTF